MTTLATFGGGGGVTEDWQTECAGAVRAAPALPMPVRSLLRVAVLVGVAVAAWLLCGSAPSYADPGPAGGQHAGGPAVSLPLISTLWTVPTLPATPARRTVSALRTATVPVRQPASRIAAEFESAIDPRGVSSVPSPDHVARAVTAFPPAAPLLRPVNGALPMPGLRPLAQATGSTAGSVAPVAPVTEVTEWLGDLGGQAGPGQRPSAVPLPDISPAAHPVPLTLVPAASTGAAWERDTYRFSLVASPALAARTGSVRTPVRPGPARSPRREPGGSPLPVPAVPPAPADVAGPSGPTAAAVALPVDRWPVAAPPTGRSDRRIATGTVGQRGDDPSVTPD